MSSYDPHTDWGTSGSALSDLLDARTTMEKQPSRAPSSPPVIMLKPHGRYDIRYRDPELVRPHSEMELLMAELERPTVEAIQRYQRYYTNAFQTFLAGVDWDSIVTGTPLCDQEIPAEGVE